VIFFRDFLAGFFRVAGAFLLLGALGTFFVFTRIGVLFLPDLFSLIMVLGFES
jgi:hypothetical protein